MVSLILEWTNKQRKQQITKKFTSLDSISPSAPFSAILQSKRLARIQENWRFHFLLCPGPQAAALARSPAHPTWSCPVSLLAQQQCRQMTLPPPQNALSPGLLALWLLPLRLLFWILFSLVWKHWGTLDSGPNIGLTLFSVHVISLQGLILSCGLKAFFMSDFFYSANYFWNSSMELHVLIGFSFSFLSLVFINLSTYWWTFGLCSVWGYYK